MTFKQGKFYAICGTDSDGDQMFLEATGRAAGQADRLKAIARKAARSRSSYDDYEDDDDSSYNPVRSSDNPFALRTWSMDTEFSLIMSHMRMIRKACQQSSVDANSLRIVIVETGVTTYIPESPSEEEIELRKFALEKLSQYEKELLKVTHWEVYAKLADRSMLPDDEED